MKRIIIFATVFVIFSCGLSFGAGQEPPAGANEKSKDPIQLFYKANTYYEKGDFQKAIETYITILDSGLEGGNLYYNIGNSFFKLGKLGYAILCYEKAKKFIPGDSDLKSNLAYAQTLVGQPEYPEPAIRAYLKNFTLPLRGFSLNGIAIFMTVFYVIVILISAVFVANPLWAKKLYLVIVIFILIFLYSLTAFGLRYYYVDFLKHGIVVQKEVDAKYEPIDTATTYYNLNEGDKVVILKTRNGWRQIKRRDNKIAWVDKEAIQEF